MKCLKHVFLAALMVSGGLSQGRAVQAIISDFSPKVGAPGDKVIITGSGFFSGGVTVVFWNKKAAVAPSGSDTEITVTVPSGISTGPIAVQQTGVYTNYSMADYQAIGSGPFITDFTPLYGPTNALVEINGVHFTGVAANGVKFNGVTGTGLTVNSDGTYMSVRVPYGATSGFISVTTPVGTSNSPAPFTVIGPGPYVTSFSPYFGTGNMEVFIDGLQLGNVTAVRFNGVAGQIVSATATEIGVMTPANVTTGPIAVEAPMGTNVTLTNFFVPPQITGVSPASGRAGTNVTITGANFLGATVRFGNTLATNVTINNTTIHAVVPAGAASGTVRVTAPAGSAFSAAPFKMLPTIFGFSPYNGLVGATTVTISGANLNEGLSSVAFNNVTAQASAPTYGQVTAVVPNTTTGPISVTTSNGSFTTATNFFLPPTVSGVTPNHGPQNSTVIVSGQNLLGVYAVYFNGQPAASFGVSNNTTLGAVVPAGASSGPITVIAPGGMATSTSRFYGVPSITLFAPAHGLPGTNVTLGGANLLDASAVRFGGVAGAIVSGDNNQLTATVPNGAQTGPITVVTPGGTNSTATPFTLDYTCDLEVSLTNAPNPVTIGSNLLLTVTIKNNGPFDAVNAALTNSLLPAGATVVSSSITAPWTLVPGANPLAATAPLFPVAGVATLQLNVRPAAAGSLVDTIAVSSLTADPLSANNTASLVTTVEPLPLLSIQSLTNTLRLSWPFALSNFVLEYKNSLDTNSDWSTDAAVPFISGTLRTVIETNTSSPRFYRLHR